MGERFQAITEGLKKALHLQGVHKEVMSHKEGMSAKPAMQEKPVNTVELTEEQAEEANEFAENNYTEQQEQDRKVA